MGRKLQINLYRGDLGAGPAMDDLVYMIAAAYRMGAAPRDAGRVCLGKRDNDLAG
jgi:hypothetical protein